MLKKCINTAINIALFLEKTWHSHVKMGVARVATWITVKWWQEGSLKSDGKVVTPDVGKCGAHYKCSELAGRSLKCACLHILCIPLDAVFCVHLVFLMDKIVHKQMQNLHYAKIITLEYICVYKIGFIAELTVFQIH